MKDFFINTLKKYRCLYTIYYYIASSTLRFLGYFVKSSKNEFLIVCYGGKKYGDNVGPVYETLLLDSRFDNWKFVWAFRNPEKVTLPDMSRSSKCKIDSLTFFYHALRAKCWLTNISVQRGLNFMNKGTFYVNTWHGVPLKHIGLDIKDGTAFKTYKGSEDFDLICSMGEYDAKVARTAFGVDVKNIKVTGYPRNDIMFTEDYADVVERLSQKLNIDLSKKTILYAPTYRDYNINKAGAFYFESKLSINDFRKALGNDYQLIVRAHGLICSSKLDGYIDASTYPNVEDLLRITDILITDYSGIMFDYSLLGKPTVCYAYDLEKYKTNRGFYVDYEKFIPFPICFTEKELYSTIKSLKYNESCDLARKFVNQCGLIDKGASLNVVNAIYEGLIERGMI